MSKPYLVYISLGSCYGDRTGYLRSAATRLRTVLTVEHISRLYIAKVEGDVTQEEWISAVIGGTTTLSPVNLLRSLQTIERQVGRVDDERQVLCPIDLDILFYGSAHMESSDLVIPHPRLPERPHVLKPMAELNPYLVHPVLHYTVAELLHNVDDLDEVRVYQP